jgi:hypothetical protein
MKAKANPKRKKEKRKGDDLWAAMTDPSRTIPDEASNTSSALRRVQKTWDHQREQQKARDKGLRAALYEQCFKTGVAGGSIFAFAWSIGYAHFANASTFWATACGLGYFLALFFFWSLVSFAHVSSSENPRRHYRLLISALWLLFSLIASATGMLLAMSLTFGLIFFSLSAAWTPLLYWRLGASFAPFHSVSEGSSGGAVWGIPGALAEKIVQQTTALLPSMTAQLEAGLKDYFDLQEVIASFSEDEMMREWWAELQGVAVNVLEALLRHIIVTDRLLRLAQARPQDLDAAMTRASAQQQVERCARILHDLLLTALRQLELQLSDEIVVLKEQTQRLEGITKAFKEIEDLAPSRDHYL